MVCGVNMYCFISVQRCGLESVCCRVIWRKVQAHSLFVPLLQHISFYTKNVIFGNVLFVCQVLPSCPSRVQIWAWYVCAHKLIRCWMEGVERLFAAGLCSCVLGTGSHQVVSHALCNELVLTFESFGAWCAWCTSHWVSDMDSMEISEFAGREIITVTSQDMFCCSAIGKIISTQPHEWQYCSFSLFPLCKEMIPCAALCVCKWLKQAI